MPWTYVKQSTNTALAARQYIRIGDQQPIELRAQSFRDPLIQARTICLSYPNLLYISFAIESCPNPGVDVDPRWNVIVINPLPVSAIDNESQSNRLTSSSLDPPARRGDKARRPHKNR
ncbi:hypothetical protein PGT21_026881 [Puccinia graminis f. sp. tritici]|uniref:Uncharacterized protein n=1 Tax=Puccinia graminis f. sp. tritici TaxID=56615 RepID=A0A5B0N1T2_PUCGR|nr:hypothetical protein PGT21_026881 [Puccinia graminis f. sp. tritici]